MSKPETTTACRPAVTNEELLESYKRMISAGWSAEIARHEYNALICRANSERMVTEHHEIDVLGDFAIKPGAACARKFKQG